MSTFRTQFFKLKAFRDRFRFASGGLGPYTKVGPNSYVSGTAGEVTVLSDINTPVIFEPDKFHWPK